MRVAPLLAAPVLAGLVAWGCAALWIDGPASRLAAGVLSGGFAVASLALLLAVRPFRRALGGFALLFSAVLAWWLSLPPSHEREWEPSVARSPTMEIDGDDLTVTNLRNFSYTSEEEFTERWEERRYELSRLRGVDLFLSYWGSPWIAHTIVSWDFGDGEHLAISIETRKEVHESYSAVLGFFRQFELHYVVADERDVIGVRTNHRGEDVYLYRVRSDPELARLLLLDYAEEINRLSRRPRWYNALTTNCTTAIDHHVEHVAPGDPWNWRILVNGKLDELAYMRGNVDTSLPFAEFKRRSRIVERARAAGESPAFSSLLREGLPGS